ncbi:MAG: phosphatase PAP2 family protein [Flavobacteriales bacterium]|nr:phosphatase PAP2 family protein [Flavobacteriales bacterium]
MEIIEKVMGKNIKYLLTESLFFRLFIVYFIAWGSLMYNYGNQEMLLLINENHNGILDPIFKYVTHIGGGWFTFAICLVIFAMRFKWGIIAAISFMGSAVITQVLKRLVFDWDRPGVVFADKLDQLNLVEGVHLHSSFSFPSGHATAAAAAFCLLSLIMVEKKYLGFLFCFLAIMAGFSRAYLMQHFPSDILVGSIIGALTSLIVYAWLKDKKFGSWGDKSFFKKAS